MGSIDTILILHNCNPQVKALCNRTMACGHMKRTKRKNASNMITSKTNIFLALLGSTYGTGSREGITIEVTAVHLKY